MSAKTSKRTVVKSAVRVVRLDDLAVDSTYQREIKKRHARIVAEFNEEALGVPLIGERADGSKWIVDGLQRVTAIKKMGRKEVRAEVFASKGSEHEAEVFKLVNLNRTKLSPHEEFRALLTAHDEMAWEIKGAVEAEGFKIVLGKTGKSADSRASEITCVKTLRNVAQRWGVEPIRFALRMAKKAWPGDPLGVYNYIIGGMAIFFNRHEGIVDEDRLVACLQTTNPQKIMYTAQQLAIGTGGTDMKVADVLERVSRKRRRTSGPSAQ